MYKTSKSYKLKFLRKFRDRRKNNYYSFWTIMVGFFLRAKTPFVRESN